MTTVSFADVVHQYVSFSRDNESHALVLELIDNCWIQRLRDISQTANTRLVYMFSEHSRFGHCVGVSHLACELMDKLAHNYSEDVEKYRIAVSAAALLHDVGHLAPGSHTAQKAWFPNDPDSHELLSVKIIREDAEIEKILRRYGEDIPETIGRILMEDPSLPPWTWEIISGGGWNVDRGNWCIVDSILAGVSYGKYNIPALTESIVISEDKHLALRENRLDAMMHFAISRHAMYRQIYQHRVLLSADTIGKAIVQRARDLGSALEFADDQMKEALKATNPEQLTLETIFWMREAWWRYHLSRWSDGVDEVLRDLSRRILNRQLFKTVRIRSNEEREDLNAQAKEAVMTCGYDPIYYLHEVSTIDVHEGDSRQSMLVLLDSGKITPLNESEPLIQSMVRESKASQKIWLAMPKEAKEKLGRSR